MIWPNRLSFVRENLSWGPWDCSVRKVPKTPWLRSITCFSSFWMFTCLGERCMILKGRESSWPFSLVTGYRDSVFTFWSSMVFDIILGLQQKLAKEWYNIQVGTTTDRGLPLAFQETDVNELRQKVEELQEQQGSQSPQCAPWTITKMVRHDHNKNERWNPWIWVDMIWIYMRSPQNWPSCK